MPDENSDAEVALKKLGERVRDGFNKRHPASERSLETFRKGVRDQYEQEQKAAREKTPTPDGKKKQNRESPERDQGR